MNKSSVGSSWKKSVKMLSVFTLASLSFACAGKTDVPVAKPTNTLPPPLAAPSASPNPPSSPDASSSPAAFTAPVNNRPMEKHAGDAYEPNRPEQAKAPANKLPEKKDVTETDREALKGISQEKIAKEWPEHPLAQANIDKPMSPSKTVSVGDYLSQVEPFTKKRLSFTTADLTSAINSGNVKELQAIGLKATADSKLFAEYVTTVKSLPFPAEGEPLKHKLLLGLNGVLNAANMAANICAMTDKKDMLDKVQELDGILYASIGDLEANCPRIINELRAK